MPSVSGSAWDFLWKGISEEGWVRDAAALLALVLLFNFVVKWMLKRLHQHYKRQNNHWKDSFFSALYRPLSAYVWYAATALALNIIFTESFGPLPKGTKTIVLLGGAVVAAAWFLIRWKKAVVHELTKQSRKGELAIDPGIIGGVDRILTIAILFFSLLLLLEVSNYSVATLLAFGGIGGLALAFASQEIIANFFSGFMLFLTRPFTIGEWILLPEKDIEGHVEEIGWYMTRIRSLDKRPVYIPNAVFSKMIVTTPSRMSHRRIMEKIGIRYEDLPKFDAIAQDIRAMLSTNQEIDARQPIIVRLESYGAYAVEFLLIAFTSRTDGPDFMRVKEGVLLNVAAIIAKHGAAMAYPTQVIITQK